jgi:DUF1009 family protein
MGRKLGILAGRGALPRAVMQTCQSQGRPFFVIAFDGQTEAELVQQTPHKWCRLGAANDIITSLKQAEVADLIMVGAMTRPSLGSLAPDWRATKILARIGWRMGDDGLLRSVIKEFENEGFRVIGVSDVIPDLLTVGGTYGKISPSAQALEDIKKGQAVLRSLSNMDVGQAVVVQHGMVLGIEAAEGTDELIQRCQTLQRAGEGAVLVKMRKLGQESRADLPAIGPVTIQNAAKAGFCGIAVEAGGTIILECDAARRQADQSRLFLYGFVADDQPSPQV